MENIILETGIKGKVQIDVCNSLAKEGLKAHTYDNGDVTLTVNKELLETTSGVDIRRALVSNPLLYKKFK